MIGIVDCGSGNIASVRLAFDRLGVPTDIRTLPDVSDLQALVLPGQGRFGTVMNALTERGWDDVLKGWIEADRKFLGICVGMQVLFEGSEEDPGVSGLGMLTGTVKRLRAPKNPMMGWARVCWRDSIFSDGSAFFVNGYAVAKSDVCCATTEYGEPFCCAVQRGHMFATQFHPEKSGKWGQEVLRQWINS
ncbi:MAG: imidazole glycerol phosphate synthase subunit HisH [Acidobacteria bacterium]|nr:imidazole glycerol phosphate synthase subunit HisH [Acidobacteriota bacterium]